MLTEQNIIAIRKKDIKLAHEAFKSLMEKTENILNREAQINPQYYKQLTPSALECAAINTIKTACENTPFSSDDVQLISGQRFPDIVVNHFFGIEVKSTRENHWTSTGSSIVETTRVDNVDDIYMLFGKLGGEIPQFKCKPYQSVLSDIAVTHSPRYLINMELEKDRTIFSKMGTTYDDFRKSKDNISLVREYYRRKAVEQGKQEMPWWITSENIDKAQSFNVKLWNTLETYEKRELQAKCMILFPEALNPAPSKTKYNNTTLWLCSYNQVVNPNIRDLYSAGGKITHVDGKRLNTPAAQVFNIIVDFAEEIKAMLSNPSDELYAMVKEFNHELLRGNTMYENWVKQVEKFAQENNVPLSDWIMKKPTFLFSK